MSSSAAGPASLWLDTELPTASEYSVPRAFRFTRTILTRRGGAGKGLYAAYVTGLFGLVYGIPSMSAVISGLAAPSVVRLWHEPYAVAALAPLTSFTLLLVVAAAAIRGPIAPAPSTVDFLAASPLPRRLTLGPSWLGNAGIFAAIFGIVALAAGLGLNRGDNTPAHVIFAVFCGGVLAGIGAAAFWRMGQLGGRLKTWTQRAIGTAMTLQIVWLALQFTDATTAIPHGVKVALSVITGPGGWNTLLWHDALSGHLTSSGVIGLVLLAALAAYALLDQTPFSRVRIDDLRRQARRSASAISAAYTGDLRSARMGLTPRQARLRRISLQASGVYPMLTQRDLIGTLRQPLLPGIGFILIALSTLLLHSAFLHAEASIFTTPLALLSSYFGLSLWNEGSRMHADNGGRTSLWGASYRKLAFAHCILPALVYLATTELIGLLAISRGFGSWHGLVWMALMLPLMLGMQTVSNYRGSMPLTLMVGSPTSPGSGPFMMVIWLLYPLLLSVGALWPLTYFAAHGAPILRQLAVLAIAAFFAVLLARWQTGKHNRRRAHEGTFMERMQAQADAAKAESASTKR